jgi:hypothetical protein
VTPGFRMARAYPTAPHGGITAEGILDN